MNCLVCRNWVHKQCSGIKTSLRNCKDFICKTCSTTTDAGIFPSIFCYCYSVEKVNLQLSFKTQSSIFYHFNNSYSIASVKVLFLILYPLEKHFKERYIFSVFYSGSAFSSNLMGFELKHLYSLSQTTMGAFWVSLTRINSTHKTQSSKQKRW